MGPLKLGYWDMGPLKLGYWDMGPLKLGYRDMGPLKLGYLGYRDPPLQGPIVILTNNAKWPGL